MEHFGAMTERPNGGLAARPAAGFRTAWAAAHLRTLDVKQAELGCDASGRGETAELAPGRHYAVARHDDRKRILPQRFTHLARGAAVTKLRGNLPIGERRAKGDGPGDCVDALVELRHAFHVEHDG